MGLGGEEPRLGPGSRYPACAARGARGLGRNVFPGREARPARGPRHPARWPWGGELGEAPVRKVGPSSEEAEGVLAPQGCGFKISVPVGLEAWLGGFNWLLV